ncbi:MAG: hypothetical protein E7400_00815 [Ruminococcaceae bacterium]|nr:hypothetical protein [Oscillospiraceae bacterium]
MLENIYTTKMSANKKLLQNRFTKIRSKTGRISKIMSCVMAVLVAVTMLCATVVMAALDSTEEHEVKIFYNNENIEFNNKPFFYDRTVYLPLIELFDTLELTDKSEIKWDNGKIQIKIDEHQSNYEIHIGQNKIVYINFWNNTQNDVLTPTSPMLRNGIIYIPFDYVEWIINRYNYNYDISFTFGGIDSKTPYLGNAEWITYPYICDLQFQVDNGHFSWRTDAQQVIQAFFEGMGMGNGEITVFAGDGTKCSATYTTDDASYIIELFKPVQRDENGIWVVKKYYNANNN